MSEQAPLNKSYNHLEAEQGWYLKWHEAGLFQADPQAQGTPFSMILPPPNVTGSLHMGHALTFTLPDIIARRRKMLGQNVLWLPGVDHAGIATQMVVEKNLQKEGRPGREDMGRDKFLELVWDWKEKAQQQILEQVKKLGLSLDWSRMKFTLSPEMSRVVSRVFVNLYEQGLIYRGTYMVNRCPSCRTVLSDLEVEHKELQGELVYLRYPAADASGRFITVATTRAETMLGDVAVAVNGNDPRYQDLIGRNLELPLTGRIIPVIADDEVDREFGSGAVKITPAHDPFDYKLALRHGLEKIEVIDGRGLMSGPIPEQYRGLDRLECRRRITADLEKAGLVEKRIPHLHGVGHCQRCETMVEPLLSEQWFLKTSDLAGPAINAVEKGEIVFIPDKWKKVYFNWMYNIQDWCISRQLWWGHRIPAFTCAACGRLQVSVDPPAACPDCRAEDWRQDEDVLDTWFSSALWPFSTLGWQDDSADFKTYYPTTLMATGFDIIFFWVARMIMMGLHFTGEVPFREVLINGLIRDEKGRKMSKTKNNVVDPLVIISEYGADALRFCLAVQAVPGMDIALSIDRIRGYKAFANKIWNASRFVLMNLRTDERELDRELLEGLGQTDRWLLHGLNNLVEKVNRLMDDYRLFEAADLIYHFFWDEFCDWHLEFAKNDTETVETRSVLRHALAVLLKLLHPFMPYISEEIWQKLRWETEPSFLLQTPFPQFDSRLVFLEDFDQVETLKSLISETRRTRTENRIDPNKRVRISLLPDSRDRGRVMQDLLKYFDFLTRSSGTEIIDQRPEDLKGFKGLLSGWEIILPFDDEADRLAELGRLQKELEQVERQAADTEAKIGNQAFVSRAPAEVVLKTKQNLQAALEKKQKLQKTIADLS